jgi:hypothetical protein
LRDFVKYHSAYHRDCIISSPDEEDEFSIPGGQLTLTEINLNGKSKKADIIVVVDAWLAAKAAEETKAAKKAKA